MQKPYVSLSNSVVFNVERPGQQLQRSAIVDDVGECKTKRTKLETRTTVDHRISRDRGV